MRLSLGLMRFELTRGATILTDGVPVSVSYTALHAMLAHQALIQRPNWHSPAAASSYCWFFRFDAASTREQGTQTPIDLRFKESNDTLGHDDEQGGPRRRSKRGRNTSISETAVQGMGRGITGRAFETISGGVHPLFVALVVGWPHHRRAAAEREQTS